MLTKLSYRREWLIALPILIVSVGQTFSKLGVQQAQETGVPVNLLLVGGYSMLVLRGLIWIYILKTVKLAFAYPMMSISYIVILFISWLLFDESITFPRVAGCLMIMLGVGVVTIAEARMNAQEQNLG